MAKNLYQDGRVWDHTLTAPAQSGDVIVVGDTVGIAITSGLTGDTIALHVVNVFDLPKASATTFAQGDPVYWDAGGSAATAATGVYAGRVARPAENGQETVAVSLNFGAAPAAGGGD